MKTINWLKNILGFNSNFENIVENKNTCIICKFNKISHCYVGTYLAKQGKSGICYDGELYKIK